MSPAQKLRGRGSKLTAGVRSRMGYLYCELIEICLVDAAECRPIVEDFDRPLMLYGHCTVKTEVEIPPPQAV